MKADIKDLNYIVVLYDANGAVAVRSTENKVFMIAMPFEKEETAREYIEDMEKLINKKGLVFKRV